MNEMTGSSWGFKRFDRICLTVNRNKFREVSQQKIIEKYFRVDESDDDAHDTMSVSGGEVTFRCRVY